jgi:hypothetical protein
MSLIVENGTGLSNAESLISVSELISHHVNRGNTNINLLSTQEAEEALRRTSDYFLQTYKDRWKGCLLNTTQALDWPRSGIVLNDGSIVYPGTIPARVKQAFADLAFKAAGGELLGDISQQVIRQKVDVLEVEYQPNTRQTKRYTAIDAMLAPYLTGYSAGLTMELYRS